MKYWSRLGSNVTPETEFRFAQTFQAMMQQANVILGNFINRSLIFLNISLSGVYFDINGRRIRNCYFLHCTYMYRINGTIKSDNSQKFAHFGAKHPVFWITRLLMMPTPTLKISIIEPSKRFIERSRTGKSINISNKISNIKLNRLLSSVSQR